MQFAFSPPLLALALSTVLCLGLSAYCFLRRDAPGALALAATWCSSGWWSATYALELAGVGLDTKLFWAHLKFLGVATSVPLWCLFTLCLVERGTLLRRLIPLALVPCITVGVALSGDPGGLLYRTAIVEAVAPFTILTVSYGHWFGVHLAFNVALMAIGGVLLIQELWRPAALIRRQALIALLAVVPPAIGSWARIFGWGPWPGLDYAPFALLVMGLLMLWAFYGERVLDLVPIAREAVIEGMRDAVLVLDPRGRLLDLNPAARQLVPATTALFGRPLAALLPLPSPLTAADSLDDASATVALTIGGVERAFDCTRTPLIVRGVTRGAVVSLRDVTDRERAMAQIVQLAQHDALTGLLNRATFIARLDATLEVQGGVGTALLFLDLDGFKAINDTHGHAAGDGVLVEAATRLRSCIPASGLCARLGGDEFTVCLATTDSAAIAAVVREIQRALGRPFALGAREVRLAVSIGSAVAPHDGRDASALLHAADVAMYAVKGLGREGRHDREACAVGDALALNRPLARAYPATPRSAARVAGSPMPVFEAHRHAASVDGAIHAGNERLSPQRGPGNLT